MSDEIQQIAIFGATGGTGRAVVAKALASGFRVTAFARTPPKVGIDHPQLTLRRGDVLDIEGVCAAVRGHDAVISCLGAAPSDKGRVRERGTENIIGAMKRAGVRRLVSQSSYGIAETASELPWTMRWVIVPLFLKTAFADHEAQETVVRNSDLDWTLVRPPHLVDGHAAPSVAHGPVFDPQTMTTKVSRTDVAAFMVQEVTRAAYVQSAVVVSTAAGPG